MTLSSPVQAHLRRLSAPLAGAMVASLLVGSAAVSAVSLGGSEHASVLHVGAPAKATPQRKEY